MKSKSECSFSRLQIVKIFIVINRAMNDWTTYCFCLVKDQDKIDLKVVTEIWSKMRPWSGYLTVDGDRCSCVQMCFSLV